MTLQEILKAKGLSDEVIEAVSAEMKQNKIYLTLYIILKLYEINRVGDK